jgi:glutaredoxin
MTESKETLPEVILYTRAGCHLCEEAKEEILRVRAETPFAFRSVDIDRDPALVALYNEEVPVIFVNGEKAFRYRVDAGELRKRLRAVR